ncbi:cytochrome c-type biogenesis protein [Marinobacter sp. 1_MG-2023]|uniref:cytochrome c-type biogenesis protein n=1 Tax=Marinobacter sp. 1_MG-2023 TaxID=3062627 RepID=UPI0026E27B9A|nr:cytochrome c-type biogenesis protein [Marinobacter sp. 1_MG-2023]MDO6823605.1 cytochrome c-type biogenesis protein CcmH [Marinobacter sp. 1_MG-2023]
MLRMICFLMAVLASGLSIADVSAVYDFDTRSEEQRYQNLIAELRCPKCQNQNIADSNAPISKDMRNAVYQMMQDGASNEEIVDSLVGRFGEFVKYKPDLDSRTFMLWATPAIAVLGGLFVVAGVVVRSRRAGTSGPALSKEEQARIDEMLAKSDQNDNG